MSFPDPRLSTGLGTRESSHRESRRIRSADHVSSGVKIKFKILSRKTPPPSTLEAKSPGKQPETRPSSLSSAASVARTASTDPRTPPASSSSSITEPDSAHQDPVSARVLPEATTPRAALKTECPRQHQDHVPPSEPPSGLPHSTKRASGLPSPEHANRVKGFEPSRPETGESGRNEVLGYHETKLVSGEESPVVEALPPLGPMKRATGKKCATGPAPGVTSDPQGHSEEMAYGESDQLMDEVLEMIMTLLPDEARGGG